MTRTRRPGPDEAKAPAPDTEAVRRAAASAEGTLALAEALVASGRAVDLAGLDREVAGLCAAAAALPPAEGRALRGDLAVLLARVDSLLLAARAAAPDSSPPTAPAA